MTLLEKANYLLKGKGNGAELDALIGGGTLEQFEVVRAILDTHSRPVDMISTALLVGAKLALAHL